jgi:hypothetical protein
MSLKRLATGALVVVCTFVVQAASQKNELSGILGRTFTANQGIQGAPSYDLNLHFGKGLTFEGNYARRVIEGSFWSLALEVPFVVNVDEDVHSAQDVTPRQYSSFFVTPAARLSVFSEQAFSPWVSFGGGFGHFNESSTLQFGGPNPGKTGTSTGVLQGGFGLDVKIYGHFSLRGEAREFWSGVPQLNVNTGKSRQYNLFAGGGVVWHF